MTGLNTPKVDVLKLVEWILLHYGSSLHCIHIFAYLVMDDSKCLIGECQLPCHLPTVSENWCLNLLVCFVSSQGWHHCRSKCIMLRTIIFGVMHLHCGCLCLHMSRDWSRTSKVSICHWKFCRSCHSFSSLPISEEWGHISSPKLWTGCGRIPFFGLWLFHY